MKILEYLCNANNKIIELLSYFNSKVNFFPYNKISQEQILQNENDYAEHKIISPYKYIEMKNYGKLFNKIYELCFLKCEPLLNNINDDKKIIFSFLEL